MDNNKNTYDPKSEQWRLAGNCKICRRKRYCKTSCKAHNLTVQQNITAAVMNAMLKCITKNN